MKRKRSSVPTPFDTSDAEADHQAFTWEERGGPAAGEPDHKGFGSKLINKGLRGAGGGVSRYDSSGFSVRMTAILSQLQRAS